MFPQKKLIPVDGQEYTLYTTQHSLKSSAAGSPVVVAPLFIYSDDTSGNRSKKWNKFDLWCVSLACLPKYEARKINNIHFVGCSNRLSALEMSDPIVEDLCMLERGIRVYDSFLRTEILVIAPVICLLADNV